MPLPDYYLVLVDKGQVQYGWPAIVDWVGSEYVGGVSQKKICCIADIE